MALNPEKEFQKGLQALKRGRDDVAALRFMRAEKGGIDVRGRVLAGATAGKQKIVSGKGMQELSIDQYKEINGMKPVQSGLGKEWNPDSSAAMRRNLERGNGQHHVQNSPRNVTSSPSNTPLTVPGGGGGAFPQLDVVRGTDGSLIADGPDTMLVAGVNIVWVQINTNVNGTAGYRLELGSLGYSTPL